MSGIPSEPRGPVGLFCFADLCDDVLLLLDDAPQPMKGNGPSRDEL